MKIIFCNINKRNKDVAHVVKLVNSVKPDLLFLAECSPEIVSATQTQYEMISPAIFDNPKVHGFIVSGKVECSLKREYNERLSFYRLAWQGKEFLLGTVHLLSKNCTSALAQSLVAEEYVRMVRIQEEIEKHKNTILIGDFNMNPFDSGMVSASVFNAVCSQEIALKQSRKFQRKDYDYFFNPAWKNYAGVGNAVYGTYYHHSCGMDGVHWNNFDQVLIRPSILQQYKPKFSVLHELGFDLRNKNNGVSDHYPILLEL